MRFCFLLPRQTVKAHLVLHLCTVSPDSKLLACSKYWSKWRLRWIIIRPLTQLDTVKPVLSGHSKIDKTKVLMENGSLMKVESIAECSDLEKQFLVFLRVAVLDRFYCTDISLAGPFYYPSPSPNKVRGKYFWHHPCFYMSISPFVRNHISVTYGSTEDEL